MSEYLRSLKEEKTRIEKQLNRPYKHYEYSNFEIDELKKRLDIINFNINYLESTIAPDCSHITMTKNFRITTDSDGDFYLEVEE